MPDIAESYTDTVRRLASAQKNAAPGAPAYSILINRPTGRLFAAAAFRAGLTPNQVTMISGIVTFTGIILIATLPTGTLAGIAIWLLLAVGYALDSADGQVARLRGGGSPSGEWLDHVVDSIKIVSIHLAVLVTMYRHFKLDEAWLLVPLGFTIVACGLFFAMILNDQLKAVHAATTGIRLPPPARSASLGRSLLVIPTDYGILCLVFVLLGSPTMFFAVYAFLFVANAGYFALALVKWFRDMARLSSMLTKSKGSDVVR